MNLDRFSEGLDRLVARCGASPKRVAQVLLAKAAALDPNAWDVPAQFVDHTAFSLIQEVSEPEPEPPQRYPWGPDPLPQADGTGFDADPPCGFAGGEDGLPQA